MRLSREMLRSRHFPPPIVTLFELSLHKLQALNLIGNYKQIRKRMQAIFLKNGAKV